MRRVLRTHRNVTWISALSSDPCHLAQHCLVRVVAEELEASKGCRVQSFARLVGQSLTLLGRAPRTEAVMLSSNSSWRQLYTCQLTCDVMPAGRWPTRMET